MALPKTSRGGDHEILCRQGKIRPVEAGVAAAQHVAGEGTGLLNAHPALIGQAADQARLIGGSIGGAPGQQDAEQGDGGAAKRPGSGPAQGMGHREVLRFSRGASIGKALPDAQARSD